MTPTIWKTAWLAAGMTLALIACSDDVGGDKAPAGPPRPMTMEGKIFTAQWDLPRRPALPPPAAM